MAKHETTVVLKAKDETKRALDSATKGMEKTERAATAMSGAIRAAAGVISIAAAGGFIKSTLNSVDALAKQSRQLGVSVERLQEFEFAASQSGVEMNTLTMALQRFGRRSAEARAGFGEALNALAELDIQLNNADGSMRSVNDLFTESINKLGQMENAAQRNALAMKLFDSEGVRLVRFGDNLDSLTNKARNDLQIITTQQAEMTERINDSFDLLSRRVSTNMKSFTLDVLGGFEAISTRFTSLTQEGRTELARSENTGKRMLAQMEDLENAAKDTSKAIKTIGDSAKSAGDKAAEGLKNAEKQAKAFGEALEFAGGEQDKIKNAIEGIEDIQESRSKKPTTVLGALTASNEARLALERGNTTRAAELALKAAEELRQVEQETGKSVTNAEAFIKNFEQIAKEALERSEKAQESLKLEITIDGQSQTFGFNEEGVKKAGDFTTERIKQAARKVGK